MRRATSLSPLTPHLLRRPTDARITYPTAVTPTTLPLYNATMPFWRKKTSASSEAGFDPTYRYETSWILPPGALFAIRALLSLYAFTTIFTIFGWNGSHGLTENTEHSFSYFTNLTYWGLAFYYAVSAIHTCSYWRSGTPLLARLPRFLQIAHGVFYSTIVVYPWIVTGKCLCITTTRVYVQEYRADTL